MVEIMVIIKYDDELMKIFQEISNNFEQLYTEHKQEFANVWKEIARRLKYFYKDC